mgnify:CR=1 FL=1
MEWVIYTGLPDNQRTLLGLRNNIGMVNLNLTQIKLWTDFKLTLN